MLKNAVITLLLALSATLGYLLYAQSPTPAGTTVPSRSPLGKVLTDLREDPALANTLVGFCLLDQSGKVVATHNAQLALIPASSLKTLTTATAFEILGPDFTFPTELRATAPLSENGILDGDLILKGGGDPTLALPDLKGFVKILQEQGLKSITGRVIGDATFFPETIAGDFWDWSDVGNGYGAPCAGLNLNHNRYIAHFSAGQKEGDPAKFLKATPELPAVTFTNRLLTGPADSGDGVSLYGGPFATNIHAHGTIPLGSSDFPIDGAVPDPALFTAHHLDRLLRAADIVIGDKPTAAYHQPATAAHLLHTHHSAPLSKIISHLHAVSDNHEAEALYRLLGVRTKQEPATAIRAHWKQRGLDLSSLRLVDGSGLGRANTISAHDLARLQFLVRNGPHGQLYHDSLLVRMDGALHYKPGAMSGIQTFAGFIQSKSGPEYAFALLYNHAPNRQTTSPWTTKLLQAIAGLESQ